MEPSRRRPSEGRCTRADGGVINVGRSAQLAEQTGITLIQLAVAFVLNYSRVPSAIVGPRTMTSSSPPSQAQT